MFEATTVLAVHDGKKAAMASDGQVTMGQTVVKHGAKKIRRLYHNRVLAGFAGSVADAFTLFSLFEGQLEAYGGQLLRAAVETAKEWRTDRRLRQLEALLLVADVKNLLLISGSGEVIEPDDGIAAIGSGGPYALAAARALKAHSSLSVGEIAVEALKIAAGICIYTNGQICLEELEE